ncbi:hypothetical protein [Winogradskyella sp. PG-2]|uniref:hypothetical protein n=1 Tax=Winogradskyella sp. PG-2 TaxID=754409 RepID=UPI000458975B|nr:hypothetical protein [Winogradskyella sp. PG-2]BAO75281.1 hypothetical protein WPG_1051 [Winogradskyella sp. PG-2]
MRGIVRVVFLLSFTMAFGQYSWSPATIYMENDSIVKGEAVIRQGGKFRFQPKESLRFRQNKKDKAKKIEINKIDSIHFTVKYTEKVNKRKVKKQSQALYVTMYVEEDRERLHFLEVLKKGSVTLFGRTFGGGGGMSFMPGGTNIPMFRFYGGHNQLFLSKGNDMAEIMYDSKDIATFFSDCNALAEKVIAEKLGKDDLKTIIEYYESNCD